MYLWRRFASSNWWRDNEEQLRGVTGSGLAIIERPNREQLQLEVASRSAVQLRELRKKFAGRVKKLPRDWLKRFTRRKTNRLRLEATD